MNYSELSEVYNYNYNNSNCNNYQKELNDPQIILDDYEILLTNLDDYKKKYEDLLANNNYFLNYLKSSQNNHFNVMNIINNYSINDNNLNEIYNGYNTKIKENYEEWIKNTYTPQLLMIENNIELIENKINNYRNLFLFIINKILKSTVINDVETKKLCPICFENEVDMCINPCGHTICNKCTISNRTTNSFNKCYSCRTNIKDYIKIFFSV